MLKRSEDLKEREDDVSYRGDRKQLPAEASLYREDIERDAMKEMKISQWQRPQAERLPDLQDRRNGVERNENHDGLELEKQRG